MKVGEGATEDKMVGASTTQWLPGFDQTQEMVMGRSLVLQSMVTKESDRTEQLNNNNNNNELQLGS